MTSRFFVESGELFSWLWRASWQGSVVIGLVLLAQWLFRDQLAPRWRCALWLLVVLRLAWPWPLESPTSIFNLITPAAALVAGGRDTSSRDASAPEGLFTDAPAAEPAKPGAFLASRSPQLVWMGGMVVLSAWIVRSAWTVRRRIHRERPVTDQTILDLLEDCKEAMGLSTPIAVVATEQVSSPLLHGFIRPRLLLPAGLTGHFSRAELRHIFLHELAHVKRCDVAFNWMATALMVVHWFNPLVWLAVYRMRVDREVACDALALSFAREEERKPYGETIIKLLERFHCPASGPGMVGIVEQKNEITRRIKMIAKYQRTKTWSAYAAALFAALGLMTLTDAQTGGKSAAAAAAPASAAGAVPKIVSTNPKIGETEVDPGLAEITITFDRDMAGGFSWTGGPPDFPPGREGQKPVWRNKRTCTLPVKLEAGGYYRVGINSTRHQNFKSIDGVPARPSAIYFTTKGASDELKAKTKIPQVVEMHPANGSTDVDPSLKELRVTFSMPMGPGFSWTGGGPQFPTISPGKQPVWLPDQKTCLLPVNLKRGAEYRLGLNSASHKNFQSAGGVPLEPVVYTFKTKE